MENTDSFSQKKKKDLVQIAVFFGVLTESQALQMSKQQLLDFLVERENAAQAGDPQALIPAAPKKRGRKPSAEKAARRLIEAASLPIEAAVREAESLENLPGKARAQSRRAEAKAPVAEMKGAEAVPEQVSKSSASLEKAENSEPPRKRGRPKQKVSENASPSVTLEKSGRKQAFQVAVTDVEEVSSTAAEAPVFGKKKDVGVSENVDKKDSDIVSDSSENRVPESKENPPGRSRSRSITIGPKVSIGDKASIESKVPTENTRTIERAARPSLRTVHSPEAQTEENVEKSEAEQVPVEIASGVLEINQDGTYGFLRRENYLPGQNDLFVSSQNIRRYGLRNGDLVTGPVRAKRETDRYHAIQNITEVNGMPPEMMQRRVHFDRLTAVYPNERFTLEIEKQELSTRIIDLVAPIGKGQRGMIVSPPKAGKTILLQKIAKSIHRNNPAAKLIVLLIDERPEEVTDMQRSINGEVVYSTFDKTPENHVRVVELVLERAMRLVELGQDVVILMDSITRMARAYNLTINPTGRTLSGGLDPGALYGPKRFFGAARNIENGGSLTIVATALIETGSRMDEVIFEEFKGTGNMEVYLDRKLSEKRIFPAIDINKSGTRREDLLLTSTELDAVWAIRKAMGQLDTAQVTEMIISLLLKTKSNQQFVQSVNVSFNDKATFEAMRGLSKGGNASGGSASGNGMNGQYRPEMR